MSSQVYSRYPETGHRAAWSQGRFPDSLQWRGSRRPVPGWFRSVGVWLWGANVWEPTRGQASAYGVATSSTRKYRLGWLRVE